MKACSAAESLMSKSVEAVTATLEMAAVEADSAMQKLTCLLEITKQKGKYAMCLEATCGVKAGEGGKLEDRAAACIAGECSKCGIKRLWSGGARAAVVK